MKEPKVFAKAVVSLLTTLPGYEYESGDRLDIHWSTYRDFLYPDAKAYRAILNRRVIESLDQHGDDKTVPHKLDHRVYLMESGQATTFIDQILALGFHLQGQDDNEDGVTVDFFKTDLLQNIDDITNQLEDLAKTFDGTYDGWGTEVVAK